MRNSGKMYLPLSVFIFTFAMLAAVHTNIERPMLLLERFFKGWGWAEIVLVSAYGSLIAYFMQDPVKAPKWRRITWTIFAVFFFLQLAAGLLISEKFLMTGKLHLPIPAMIIAGPLYRGELSVMTALFISTLILTGPAWCSHLCYFGAFDNAASGVKKSRAPLKRLKAAKATTLALIITATLTLRFLKVPVNIVTAIALAFGLASIGIIIFSTTRKGRMVHCVKFCPIGTTVNVLKNINPFRMFIDSACNLCMQCSIHCKYDALGVNDIKNKKPGITCTLCGDCLPACHSSSIKYRFFSLKPETARYLYLFLTISIHSVFFGLARI